MTILNFYWRFIKLQAADYLTSKLWCSIREKCGCYVQLVSVSADDCTTLSLSLYISESSARSMRHHCLHICSDFLPDIEARRDGRMGVWQEAEAAVFNGCGWGTRAVITLPIPFLSDIDESWMVIHMQWISSSSSYALGYSQWWRSFSCTVRAMMFTDHLPNASSPRY